MNNNYSNFVQESVNTAINRGNPLSADQKARILVERMYDGVIPPSVKINARRDGFEEFGGVNINSTNSTGADAWFRFALTKDEEDLREQIQTKVDHAIQQVRKMGGTPWGSTVNLFSDFPFDEDNTDEHIQNVFSTLFGEDFMEDNAHGFEINVRAFDAYNGIYFNSPMNPNSGFLSFMQIPEDGVVKTEDLKNAFNRAVDKLSSRIKVAPGSGFYYNSSNTTTEPVNAS